jgi:hypothetical protein
VITTARHRCRGVGEWRVPAGRTVPRCGGMTRSPVRRFTEQPRPAHSRGPARVPAPASPQSADLRWVCHLGPLPMPASLTAKRNYEQATPPGAARARQELKPWRRGPFQSWPGEPESQGRRSRRVQQWTRSRQRMKAPDIDRAMRAESRECGEIAPGEPLPARARCRTGDVLAVDELPFVMALKPRRGTWAYGATTADMARCVAALLACCRAVGPRTRRHDQFPSTDERHAFPGAISLLGCPTHP